MSRENTPKPAFGIRAGSDTAAKLAIIKKAVDELDTEFIANPTGEVDEPEAQPKLDPQDLDLGGLEQILENISLADIISNWLTSAATDTELTELGADAGDGVLADIWDELRPETRDDIVSTYQAMEESAPGAGVVGSQKQAAAYNDTFSKDAKTPEELGVPEITVQSEGETVYRPRVRLDGDKLALEFGHYYGYGAYYFSTLLGQDKFKSHGNSGGVNLYRGDRAPDNIIGESEMDKLRSWMTDNEEALKKAFSSTEASKKQATELPVSDFAQQSAAENRMIQDQPVIEPKASPAHLETLAEEVEIVGSKKTAGRVYEIMSEYPEARNLIGTVSAAVDYDIGGAMAFALHLLEDVNASMAMAETEKVFEAVLTALEQGAEDMGEVEGSKTAAAASVYAMDMATILFVDAVATLLERGEGADPAFAKLAEEFRSSGKELTDYIPTFLEERGINWRTNDLEGLGEDLVNEINRKWGGKLTVDELGNEFGDEAITALALASQGHGVSPEDNADVDLFMQEKGVSSDSLYLEGIGDRIADEAYWVLTQSAFEQGAEDMGEVEGSKKIATSKDKVGLEMANILFIEAVTSLLEGADEEGSGLQGIEDKLPFSFRGVGFRGVDLTKYIPSLLEKYDIGIPILELQKLGNELVDRINKAWEGKLTVEELGEQFPDRAVTGLALSSQGHGVNPEDDADVSEFMESKGVSSRDIDETGIGDSIRDLAWSMLNAFNTKAMEPGAETK